MERTENTRTSSEHAVRLAQTLYGFSKRKKYTDFVIKAAESTAYCHSPVLCAQSTFIQGLCAAGTKEANLTNFQSPEQAKRALHQTVRYLYLGTTELQEDIVDPVLQAAETIKYQCLKEECEGYMLSVLNIKNCPKYMQKAQNFNLTKLSQACKNLQRKQFSVLIYEPWFLPSLSLQDMLRYLTDDQLAVSHEDQVLDAVNRWVMSCTANDRRKEEYVDTLIPHVQLSKCNRRKLEQSIRPGNETIATHLKVKIYDYLFKKDTRIQDNPPMEKATIIVGGIVAGIKGHKKIIHLNTPRDNITLPSAFKNNEIYSVCANDTRVYISGGYDITEKKSVSALYQYCFTRGQWVELLNLPSARDQHGSVCVNNLLYIIGGVYREDGEIKHFHRVVHILNLRDLKWSTARELPYGVRFPPVTQVDGVIYVMGGDNTDGMASRRVVKYQESTDEWIDCKEMPVNEQHSVSSTVPVGKKIYVLAHDRFLLYDTEQDQWSILAKPPVPSYWCAMTHLDGALLASGGYEKWGDNKNPHNRLQKYDIASQRWILLEDTIPVALCGHSSFVVRVPRKS